MVEEGAGEVLTVLTVSADVAHRFLLGATIRSARVSDWVSTSFRLQQLLIPVEENSNADDAAACGFRVVAKLIA